MEYSGFLFDSFRCIMRCLDEKVALLREHAADLRTTTELWSMRELDRVKGRLLHYSTAIRHLRIRSPNSRTAPSAMAPLVIVTQSIGAASSRASSSPSSVATGRVA